MIDYQPNSDYNMSTDKQKEEEKLMAIVRTVSNMCTFDFSITSADTKSFFSLCFGIHHQSQNDETTKCKRRRRKKTDS